MNHDSEKWLDDRISEDVDRMADKRIKELMESEELKDIEATMDQLQSIRKRLGLVDAEDEHDMEIARELTPEVPTGSHVEAASEESTRRMRKSCPTPRARTKPSSAFGKTRSSCCKSRRCVIRC